MIQNFDNVQKLGKESLETAVKSLTAVSQGYQAIAAEVADHVRSSFAEGSAALEKLAGAGSLDKAVELQSSFAKSAYEAAVARATKIGELYAGLAKDIYQPYQGLFAKVAPTK